jgi:hypothetical protein
MTKSQLNILALLNGAALVAAVMWAVIDFGFEPIITILPSLLFL